jgi:hypothetical protein
MQQPCPFPLCCGCVLSLQGDERRARMRRVLQTLVTFDSEMQLHWLIYLDKAVVSDGTALSSRAPVVATLSVF